MIRKIAPGGSKTIEHASLTHALGGDIAVNPQDGTAAEPYFEITVDLPGTDVLKATTSRADQAAVDSPELRYGMTGSIRLPTAAEPIGTRVVRRFIRFVNKLLQE